MDSESDENPDVAETRALIERLTPKKDKKAASSFSMSTAKKDVFSGEGGSSKPIDVDDPSPSKKKTATAKNKEASSKPKKTTTSKAKKTSDDPKQSKLSFASKPKKTTTTVKNPFFFSYTLELIALRRYLIYNINQLLY